MKDIQVGYRDLLAVSGRSIQQLRRNALTVLGVDPGAARADGVAREFSLNDGFKVYLMGVLVGDYNLKLEEANYLVLRIINEMEAMEVAPEREPMNLLPSARWMRRDPVPRIVIRVHPNRVCEFRTYERATKEEYLQEERVVDEAMGARIMVTWKLMDEGPCFVRFVPESKFEDTIPGSVYEIELTAHLGHYIAALRSSIS
jgi:hypothetical protein